MSISRALTLLFLFALAWGAYAAEFKVTLPDGRKYKVTAPVDASDDEVYESALIFAQQEKAEEAAKRAQKAREKANSGIISRIRRTIGASNLWECVLDEMPGVRKDIVATVIFQDCEKNFGYANIKKKSSFFGVSTAGECIIKYGKDTDNSLATASIVSACYSLYAE